MDRVVNINILRSLCLLFIVLLMKSVSGDTWPEEKPIQETKERNKNDLAYQPSNVSQLLPISKRRNLIQYGYSAATIDSTDQSRACYVKRATSSWSISTNTRPFQQLGHYSRSLIRQMQQEKQQEREFRKPTTLLQTPISLLYNQLTPTPSSPVNEENSDDYKRTVFLSSGWAPSGLSEIQSKIQPDKQEGLDKKKMTGNSYAFTSNHWGPMGKRHDNIGSQYDKYSDRLVGNSMTNKENEFRSTQQNDLNLVPITYTVPKLLGTLTEIDSDDVLHPIVRLFSKTGNLHAETPHDLLKPFTVSISETKRKGKVKHQINVLPSNLFGFHNSAQYRTRYTGGTQH